MACATLQIRPGAPQNGRQAFTDTSPPSEIENPPVPFIGFVKERIDPVQVSDSIPASKWVAKNAAKKYDPHAIYVDIIDTLVMKEPHFVVVVDYIETVKVVARNDYFLLASDCLPDQRVEFWDPQLIYLNSQESKGLQHIPGHCITRRRHAYKQALRCLLYAHSTKAIGFRLSCGQPWPSLAACFA